MNCFSKREFRQSANATSESFGSQAIDLQNWLSCRHDDLLVMLADGIHEAGHVFAARAYGFEVAWVSLDSNFLTKNALAIENRCASGDPVAMVLATHRIDEIFKRRCVISREEWDTVRGYYVQCMAGPIAEADFNPCFRSEVGTHDYCQADTLLWRATGQDKFQFKRKRKRFIEEAAAFVETNRYAIFHLGAMIHNHQTILEPQIDGAIAEARRLAAPMTPMHKIDR